MSEATQISFTFKEIVEALVKRQDIHEGLWGIYFEFGLGAANVRNPKDGNVLPAAIIPVQKIGIQRFDEPSNLTIDAAVVNPKDQRGG